MEAASEDAWYAPGYGDDAIHARDLPVVATALPLLRRHGADAPVWHRFGRRLAHPRRRVRQPGRRRAAPR
ncbi:hypothetical protein EH183_38945 [Streptomyces sp. CB01881]|nr:hypothetical protein EH183_38945 [Streptomyces sp. CB01881]